MKSNTKKLQAEIAKVLQDKYDYIGKLDAIKEEIIQRAKEIHPEAYDLKKRIAEGYEKLKELGKKNDKLLKK